mgnify:FL=1
MNDLKKFFRGKRRNDFWERVVDKNINLITIDENAESDITEDDAHRVSVVYYIYIYICMCEIL